MPAFLLVTGTCPSGAVDAYLYGDNERLTTWTDGGRFAAVVLVTTTGGFGPGPQADRLASGLYGAKEFETFEGAYEALLVEAARYR
jgi:hypothetical protein